MKSSPMTVASPHRTVGEGDAGRRHLVWLSVLAAAWALWYALYRAYYAAGGTALLPGTIREGRQSEFQAVNLAGALIIGTAAVLPLVMLPLWSRPRWRRALGAVCWIVAVGCCMHALVDITERALSLAGVVDISYPRSLWAHVDHRDADLQDLLFNEPWFLGLGLAYGAIGWVGLGPGRSRRWWVISGAGAIAALYLLGVLTMSGAVGRTVVL